MKYIVFCGVCCASCGVRCRQLVGRVDEQEQVSLLSRKGKLERARVAKKMSEGNAEASEDDGTGPIELEENSEAGGGRSRGGRSKGDAADARNQEKYVRN